MIKKKKQIKSKRQTNKQTLLSNDWQTYIPQTDSNQGQIKEQNRCNAQLQSNIISINN